MLLTVLTGPFWMILARRTEQFAKQTKQSIDPIKAILIIGLALLIGRAAQTISIYLPMGKNILSPYAWTILMVTTIAIICSLTPLSRIRTQVPINSVNGYCILC